MQVAPTVYFFTFKLGSRNVYQTSFEEIDRTSRPMPTWVGASANYDGFNVLKVLPHSFALPKSFQTWTRVKKSHDVLELQVQQESMVFFGLPLGFGTIGVFLGCMYWLYGYLFSKPLPIPELLAWIVFFAGILFITIAYSYMLFLSPWRWLLRLSKEGIESESCRAPLDQVRHARVRLCCIVGHDDAAAIERPMTYLALLYDDHIEVQTLCVFYTRSISSSRRHILDFCRHSTVTCEYDRNEAYVVAKTKVNNAMK